jgi:hypothetical protein
MHNTCYFNTRVVYVESLLVDGGGVAKRVLHIKAHPPHPTATISFNTTEHNTLKVFSKMVADPHHFNADPAFHFSAETDRAFHFNADPDPIFKVMGICDHWSLDLLWLYFEPPGLYCKRPRLYFEPLKLLNFYFLDPDPAFHSHADPDLASKNNADPEGQPYFLVRATFFLYYKPELRKSVLSGCEEKGEEAELWAGRYKTSLQRQRRRYCRQGYDYLPPPPPANQCCGSGSEFGSTCFWASRIRLRIH